MENLFQSIELPKVAELGNVVPEGYNYYKKKIEPVSFLNLPGASLKWYNLYPYDMEITPEQLTEAREFLQQETREGRLELENELGFVILHKAGDYLLLLVTTWRNTNEMWESIYLKKADDPGSYSRLKFKNEHRGTYCVWELGIIWHERNTWVRFLESERDEKAKLEYMGNVFSGEI